MSDFESGLMEAVRYYLPATQHLGFYFHFAQAVWRNMQETGLVSQYKDNQSVSTFVQKCIGLAFITESELICHFYQLDNG